MKEAAIQKKIINTLEAAGFFVVKNIIANKSGVPDIIACTTDGGFLAIEVKTTAGKLTKLQEEKINTIRQAGGIAFAVFGWEDFITKFKEYW